jgi:heme-degrading monooxygenase HmoA
MMIHVGFYYDVKPGNEKKFEEIFGQVKTYLTNEEGFVSAVLYRRTDEPLSYLILSEWESIEHYKKFVSSKSFKEVTESARDILSRKPYNRVFVVQKAD